MNFKNLNAVTQKDHFPLPFTEHVIERLSGSEVYNFLDGFSGYNQITIAPEDQPKTTFTTEWGIFSWRVMPFGLTNAPSDFQRSMCVIFRPLIRKNLEVFLDDLGIHSSMETHLDHLEDCFKRCREFSLCLNPLKCNFLVTHGVVLGHIVSRHGMAADESKIKVIIQMAPPKTPKDVQIFMGHVNYHRRYIRLFAELAKPLYTLLILFEWTEECEYAFNELKSRLCSAPLLRPPNWDIIFHVHTDASGQALGVVLTQPGEHQKDYPIYFASQQFNDAEANYTVTEREALAMVYSVKKFRYYLLANSFKFFVDHQALLYLVNRPCSTGRITRWLLILQEFDFEIVVKKGKQHFMADHMSRVTSG